MGVRNKGLAELVAESVEAAPAELRSCLIENIVLTGGTSRIPNLADRLRSELRAIFDSRSTVKLVHESSSLFCTKRMLDFSTSASFCDQTISKKVYEEYGSYALIYALNI